MWTLSSLTRDRIHGPLHWEHEVLTTGLLGKCQAKVNLILISSVMLVPFQLFR